MRIDRTHRGWAAWSAAIFAVAAIVYIASALHSRPSGGSALGLTYGLAGYGMMLFAALLGARKRVPVWRLGRAQTWMRGHLWLGLLSLPTILFHAAFSARGPLTFVLMLLLFVVVISGVVGALIQHYIPSVMTSAVPLETIYEQIPEVRRQLRDEADELARSITGHLDPSGEPSDPVEEVNSARLGVTVLVEIPVEDKDRFRRVYVDTLRPFLDDPDGTPKGFGNADESAALFSSLRRAFPVPVQAVLSDLENICEEQRQLTKQKRIYLLLHTWLLVHVPLSLALIALGAVHAVMALRY